MVEEQWKYYRKATASLIAPEKLRLIKFMDPSMALIFVTEEMECGAKELVLL